MIDKELKILMLEDQQDDAGLIERTLRKENIKFTYKRVDDETAFINALEEFKPDLILSDHALPQFNSIEALKICRKRNYNGPFILVTGAVSDEFAVMCIKYGADDYVLKSNLSRLPVAIKSALDQRLHEQTRRHQEEEIRKQNEELIKINRELDSFVYSISHNLRSPLASILGLVNLARIEGATSGIKAEQYFELIGQSARKLDDTLKEILDYSRNARIEVVASKISFTQVLDDVFAQLKYMKELDFIEKRINVKDDIGFYSDQYRVSIILLNLISNAIKFADFKKDKAYISIDITVSADSATIEVSDNGIGIDESLLPKIFDMFYRGTQHAEGSGLGLYINREVVKRLGGNITISSKPGKGTKLVVTIPNLIKY